jgi:pimeloyl-ACP methyl ester carboxylesterase
MGDFADAKGRFESFGNWFGCIPAYARKFRVIAVDLVGFGKTDKPVIPHCGHWAMLEYPEDFASETIRFLES